MQAEPLAWPPAFVERMAALLGHEVGSFLQALAQPRARGLRLNPAKVSRHELASLLHIDLEPVPWCPTGFLLEGGSGLGDHPGHLAGLFYLQDPSAMSAVEALDPDPGWKVIDLAAAPGGKTTHLLSRLGAGGLVVANEVVAPRLRLLHENLDRWGSAGWVTSGADLDWLAGAAPDSFDAALLDAPCSGEAMMRRDPGLASQWSPAVVEGSARRQRRLLSQAARLVRPGGTLVYSTCTFEVEENEEQVAALLGEQQPGWELAEIQRRRGFAPGLALPPWPTERSVRLWPHRVPGDGQFVARLRRTDGGGDPEGTGRATSRRWPAGRRRASTGTGRPDPQLSTLWAAFLAGTAPGLELPAGRLVARGAHLHHLPAAAEELLAGGLLARPGLPLGTCRPARFQPSQALACLLSPEQVTSSVSWPAEDERLAAFLRGETVTSPGGDGWVLVCYERWGIGWGRRSAGVIKNFLPHHLRSRRTLRSGP